MKRSGFTLLEVTFTTILASAVVMLALWLLNNLSKTTTKIMRKDDAASDVSLLSLNIRTRLQSTAPIDPAEKMFQASGSGTFRGIASTSGAENPWLATNMCATSGAQGGVLSMLRFAYIDKDIKPGRVIRPWNPASQMNLPLRLFAEPETPAPPSAESRFVGSPGATGEILLVDADGRQMSRFTVNRAEDIAANEDPYTGVGGQPTQYRWVELTLGHAKDAVGTTIPSADFKYIANSIVQRLHTIFLCIDKSDPRKVIEWDPLNQRKKDLTILPEDLVFESFDAKFANVRAADPLGSEQFFSYSELNKSSNIKNPECINTFKIDVAVRKKNDQSTELPIYRETLLFDLPNLQLFRAVNCN